MHAMLLTFEAKAAMIANLDLEINARKEKLRAMCEAQCASLRSRLERRVNRVPATKRQMPLVELLAPAVVASKSVPSKAATTKAAATKKAATIAPAPASRKTRTVLPTIKAAAPAPKTAAPKPAVAKPAPKQAAPRGKKRGSDDISSEDKENADLDIPKKRSKTTAQKAPAPSKPVAAAATTRATRAASRQKATTASQVLSPKNNNSRQKPTKSTARPR